MGKDKYNPYRRPPVRRAKAPVEVIREIVLRGAWGALDAKQDIPMVPTVLPVENVILTYYTETSPCENNESCKRTLREIQLAHMARGLPDIAYNFLIGGDLKIYEGRGWDIKPEKHDTFPDIYDDSIEIAFIGDYRATELNDMSKLITECLHAIQKGVEAKNVLQFFRIKETTPKLRIETLGEDERQWERMKMSEISLDDFDKAPYRRDVEEY